MLALDQLWQWTNGRVDWRRTNLFGATLVSTVVFFLAVAAYLPIRAAKLEETQLQQELNDLNSATADLPASSAIFVLTPGIEFQFYLAITRNLVWASKSPCAWLQAAVANAQIKNKRF